MKQHIPRTMPSKLWPAMVMLTILLGAGVAASSASGYAIYLPLIADKWPGAPDYFSEVLITEVMYGGVDRNPDLEWIEIYSRGQTAISLNGYKIGDGERQGDREGMYIFPRNKVLEPAQVIVVASRATDFFSIYGFNPDFEIFDSDQSVPDLRKYKAWAVGNINLSNSGDEVLLLNEANLVVDALSWGDSTFAFDPSISRVPVGYSLERSPADQDRDRASDWRGQPSPAPGVVDLRPPTPTPTARPTATSEPCPLSEVLITEVLYDPRGTSEPDAEWFEIFNVGDQPVWLSCLRIGDEETSEGGEGMYQFPSGSLIAPGQVVVIADRGDLFSNQYGKPPDFEIENTLDQVPEMIKDRGWASGSLNLGNAGDDLLILGATYELLDAVSWGNSVFAFSPSVELVEEGHSIARSPADIDTDTAKDWIEQSVPDPGSVDINPPPPTGTFTPTPSLTITQTASPTSTPEPCEQIELLISEVLFDPPGSGDPDGEWFEIFNPKSRIANLRCYKVGDEETQGGGEGMYTFPNDTLMTPGGVIVIAYRGTTFSAAYGFKPDFEIVASDPDVPELLKYPSWASGMLNLGNAGDDVVLLGEENNLVDAVSWGDSQFAFSPSVPVVGSGHSLERRPANQDSDSAQDWIDQSDPNPGEVDLTPPLSTPTLTPTPTQTLAPPPSPTPTPTPTRTISPQREFVINEIQADPNTTLGDANGDGRADTLEDEFIEIVNVNSVSVDLAGWTIRDAAATRHIFSAASIVRPGCGLVVFGGGAPQGSFGNSLVQIASTGSLGLNDRGDVIYLYSASGELIAAYTYGVEANDDQSVTRSPDIWGEEPFIKHSLAEGSNGSLFSPGTQVDGTAFSGCYP